MSTWTCSRSATWTFVFYARRGGRFARRRTPSEGRETRSRTRRTPPRTPPPAPSPSSPWTNASPSSTRSSGEGKVPTGRVPTGRAPTGRVPTGRRRDARRRDASTGAHRRGAHGRTPADGMPTLGRVPAAPRHPRDADTLYAAAETETAAAERLTAELVDSDARASSSARAARPGETHALLPRRAYDDPRDERRKPRDRPLRLGAADLAESAILRAMLRDGKYEEMLEFARRVEPPTDPTDGGDGGGDVPLGNRALAEADATATAARRAVVATAREHLGDDAKANEAADVVERAAERAAVAAMTSAGLLRTDRGEDPRGDVGESAALVSSNPRVDPSSVLADALRRFGDDADAAVAAAAGGIARDGGGVSRESPRRRGGGGGARARGGSRATTRDYRRGPRRVPSRREPRGSLGSCGEGGARRRVEEGERGGVLGRRRARRRRRREGRDAGGTRRARARGTREGGGGGASLRARRAIRQTRAMGAIRGGPLGVRRGGRRRVERERRRRTTSPTRTPPRRRAFGVGAVGVSRARRRRVGGYGIAPGVGRVSRETRGGAEGSAERGVERNVQGRGTRGVQGRGVVVSSARVAPRNTRGRRRGARARRRRSAGRRRRSAGRRRRSAGQWSTTSNPQDRRRSRERRKRRRRRRRPERSRRPDRHPRLRSSRHPLSRRGRD